MGDYSQLPSLIGRLKAAAIDASMTGWAKSGAEYRDDSTSGYVTSTMYVTRPAGDGSGGGDVRMTGYGVMPPEFKNMFHERFDAIRSRVDEAFGPWLTLPDPAAIGRNVEVCRQVTRRLSGAASATAAGQTGAGVIASNVALIMESSDAMAGKAAAAYKATFLARIGPAVGGLQGISLVQGAAIAAEQGLWDSAREVVVEIVEKATRQMEAIYAGGAPGSWNVALTVAGWAVKGVQAFASGGVSGALEVAGLGLEILNGAEVGEVRQDFVGSEVETALASIESGLAALNDKIRGEEEALRKNLASNLSNIRNDRSSYDLVTDPIALEEIDDGGVMRMDYALVRDIYETYMPNIAGELTEIAPLNMTALISDANRDAALGVGGDGILPEWYAINITLCQLLDEMQRDVVNSAHNLEYAARDIQQHDDDSAQALRRIVEQMDSIVDDPFRRTVWG